VKEENPKLDDKDCHIYCVNVRMMTNDYLQKPPQDYISKLLRYHVRKLEYDDDLITIVQSNKEV